MKTFAVALYSQFTCEIEMDLIIAKSAVEAGIVMIMSSDDNWKSEDFNHVEDLEDLKQFAFNYDHSINVIEVNKSRSGRSGASLQNSLAGLDSQAAFQ